MYTKRSTVIAAGFTLLTIVTVLATASPDAPRDVLGRSSNFYDTEIGTGTHDVHSVLLGDPGREYMLIDFEGIYHNDPIGTISGIVDVSFGSTWASIVDADAGLGTTGNFANEPSPDTVTASLLPVPHAPINFSDGVIAVNTAYTASPQALPLVMEAYDDLDGNGNLLDTATGYFMGNSYYGADCTGDPNGDFCKWSEIGVSSATANIRSIVFPGVDGNWFILDDMRVYLTYEYGVPASDPAGLLIMILIISTLLYFSGRR